MMEEGGGDGSSSGECREQQQQWRVTAKRTILTKRHPNSFPRGAVVYRWVTGCCCWKLLFPFINARRSSLPIVSASPYATKYCEKIYIRTRYQPTCVNSGTNSALSNPLLMSISRACEPLKFSREKVTRKCAPSPSRKRRGTSARIQCRETES